MHLSSTNDVMFGMTFCIPHAFMISVIYSLCVTFKSMGATDNVSKNPLVIVSQIVEMYILIYIAMYNSVQEKLMSSNSP